MISHGRGDASYIMKTETDQVFGAGAAYSSGVSHVPWGVMDNQPNTLAKLSAKNGQVLSTLDTLRDFLFGNGITFKKKVIEGDKVVDTYEVYDPRLEDLMGEHKIQEEFLKAIVEYVTNANVFYRYELDTKTDLLKIGVSDCFFTRIKLDDKKNRSYIYNPGFGQYGVISNESMEIPALDRSKKQLLAIDHKKIHRSGNPYYSYPAWWATQTWIELANLIPLFHKSGIENGYNLKYLIKMPKNYFDKDAGGKELTSKEIQNKWKEFSESMKKFLSGVDNVDKTILSKYTFGEDGKAMSGIEIEPIKNFMSDDAYTKVFEMSGLAIANAGNILPTMAGVNPGKGNDSGSQIRVMSDYQQHFRTAAIREVLLDPFKFWLKQNKFDRLIFPDIEAIQITTLNENKSGTQTTTSA